MQMQQDSCGRIVLAEDSGFRIDRSSCGLITLHAGPVTLRLGEDGFEVLAHVTANAMECLEDIRSVKYGADLTAVSAFVNRFGAGK